MKLALSIPGLLLLSCWAAGCLWIDGPSSRAIAGLLAIGMLAVSLGISIWVRPIRRMWLAFALPFLLVQAWWLGIEPRNDRLWLPDVVQPPVATFDGDLVTVANVRNFHYRSESDFDEHWETRTYDLSKLQGVDLFLSFWGSPMIAHTIASWSFESGPPLAISIETRKEIGEEYSAVLGFFRQFELYYVAADERDVIGVRAQQRGEQVFLYRLKTAPPVARAILVDYLEEMNRIALNPRWYNALTTNCTTTIRQHVQHVAPKNPFSWKILVNGYLPELAYDRGTIETSIPFEELRKKSDITERARGAGDATDFSNHIRRGLPDSTWRDAPVSSVQPARTPRQIFEEST